MLSRHLIDNQLDAPFSFPNSIGLKPAISLERIVGWHDGDRKAKLLHRMPSVQQYPGARHGKTTRCSIDIVHFLPISDYNAVAFSPRGYFSFSVATDLIIFLASLTAWSTDHSTPSCGS